MSKNKNLSALLFMALLLPTVVASTSKAVMIVTAGFAYQECLKAEADWHGIEWVMVQISCLLGDGGKIRSDVEATLIEQGYTVQEINEFNNELKQNIISEKGKQLLMGLPH